MQATIQPLSYKATVAKIIRLAKGYREDVAEFSNFFQLYNYVRNLDYKRDPIGKEVVSRFRYTKDNSYPIRDCDDKTVPLISFAYHKKIPCRIAVCGVDDKPHHVYPEVKLADIWLPADATYKDRCVFGKRLYNENYREIFEVN
ncbi:MAG: hypothetical protein SFU98_07335 [Leptospiraceae bacterium]|nr:hypothetical protein [Leptospiraceae bacterium]